MADVPEFPRPVLVAIGSGVRSLRLIQAGLKLARERRSPWIAAHVRTPVESADEDREQAQVWLQEARRLGAKTRELEAPTVVQGLVELVRSEGANTVVLARCRDRWPWARLGHSTAGELARRGLDAHIVVLDDPSIPSAPASGPDFPSMLGTFAVLSACAGLAGIAPAEGSLALVFLPFLAGVAVIAHRWGQGLAGLGTIVSLLFVNLLLETPAHRGQGAMRPSLLLFLAMLLAIQGATALVQRMRRQAREVHRREIHTASLYLLGRALSRSRSLEEVAAVVADHVQRAFRAQAWILRAQGEVWEAWPGLATGAAPAPPELLPLLGAAEGPGDPLEPVQCGDTYYLALTGTDRMEGVLRVLPSPDPGLPPATWELLKAFAVQAALALERLRWLEEAQRAQFERESERLRNALLGAVGHDLRTPLAAIHGAASTLLLEGQLSDSTRQDLLAMIRDESAHLSAFLANLLELTRLEASAGVTKEWQPFEEVLGSALHRVELSGGGLNVGLDLDAAPALVPMDGALVEQLLINLLVNARRHGGGRVELAARQAGDSFVLEVEDRGPGIPAEFQHLIFEKFVRLPGRGEGGVGLGLAICRAIALSHGGSIAAENRPGGGLTVRVVLPLAAATPAPEAVP